MEIEQEHPIPQQISSYQFKLVGDMTIIQFFQVAGGVLASLIVYSTSLLPLFKWPLVLLFFLTGASSNNEHSERSFILYYSLRASFWREL